MKGVEGHMQNIENLQGQMMDQLSQFMKQIEQREDALADHLSGLADGLRARRKLARNEDDEEEDDNYEEQEE